MEKQDVRERILIAAEELIAQGEGEIEQITTRAIAERAGVGIGLINYHFQTKDHLIRLCVQRMIGEVIRTFDAARFASLPPLERLTASATHVFEFLFAHPSLSRISILDDHRNPSPDCNTARTIRGFGLMAADFDGERGALERRLFELTAAMQSAFLFREQSAVLLGRDLQRPEERAAYIAELVSALFGGDAVE